MWSKGSIFFMILFLSQLALGQLDKHTHNWFDDITGTESSELHYGQVYLEKHRMKSAKSKFFLSPEFKSGVVHFNGQPYYGLNIKYDVYDDNLILQVKNKFGGAPLLLQKERIDSFAIVSRRFINVLEENDRTGFSPGFYEIYREHPNFRVLKKHNKRLRHRLGFTRTYHGFEDLYPIFILEFKNEFFILKKINDIPTTFPEYGNDLKIVIDQLGRNSKSFDDSSINVLIDFLEQRLSSSKKL